MDFFFNSLKKGLVMTLFLVFGFVTSYVPHSPVHDIPVAEAGGGTTGGALETTQWLNRIILSSSLTQETITASTLVAGWTKENVLDGLGWSIAKMVVSGMIRSTINWVNSGFEGSPAFVSDMRGFLLNIADEIAGDFISNITIGGEDLGFICSPFRLDVAIAVEARFLQGRDKGSAPTCTLSGMVNNIEGFITGVESTNPLSDWLTITSSPQTYTKYGNVLQAESNLRGRIVNAQGDEIGLLGFADGFLSKKICQTIEDSAGRTKEANCKITLPGKVISETLNKALGAGTDALVQADEINELISALLGQVANKALTGAAGLLGLSGGDGFGGYTSTPSFLDQAVDQSTIQVTDRAISFNAIDDSLRAETELRKEALSLRPKFLAFVSNTAESLDDRQVAQGVINQIDQRVARADANIGSLNILKNQYDTASDEGKIDILVSFSSVQQTTTADVGRIVADWRKTANDIGLNLD